MPFDSTQPYALAQGINADGSSWQAYLQSGTYYLRSNPATVASVPTGYVDPSQAAARNGVLGVTTNSNAVAGYVGEFVTATVPVGSAVGLTTATPANVASISLTAGDWDVSSVVDFNLTGATATLIQSGPSLVSTTLPTQPGGSGLGTDALAQLQLALVTVSGVLGLDSNPVRLSVAATTTVYLVASSAFSVGAISAFGTLRARRVR
jgi:hypothetical protein